MNFIASLIALAIVVGLVLGLGGTALRWFLPDAGLLGPKASFANLNASLAAARAATPPNLVAGNQLGGELRVFFATATNVNTVVGEFISWGFLPLGARVLFGYLTCSAGTAASTLNLGDPASPARYLAASAVNAAANIAINPPVTNALGVLANNFAVSVAAPGLATDHTELRSVVAGANLAVGQTFVLCLFYVTAD